MVMIPVAEACDVKVYCPKGEWVSFFNSPYPAHRLMTGVDIYPGQKFGDLAPSPVRGRLIAARRIRSPRGKLFEDAGYDVVLLLESLENPDKVVKLLHVEPIREIGDVVEVGEELGLLIRSGYFNFWTDPHIHVEVREPSDPLRVRGGHRFRRLLHQRIPTPPVRIRGRVILIQPEYALLALDGSFGGLSAKVGDSSVLLDGGIPHYGWLGLHTSHPLEDNLVELCGHPIAMIAMNYEDCSLARCKDVRFRVDGQIVRLSLYLSTNSVAVKLIPPRPGALRLEEGADVSIRIDRGERDGAN